MKAKMKSAFVKSGYLLLFLFSFVVFLYLTFPYGVLKESVSNMMSKNTGIDVRVGELAPSLPLGFKLTDIRISPTAGGPTVEFSKATVSVSVLNFLIGALALNLEFIDKNKGDLDVTVKFGLFNLLFKHNFLPYKVRLDADKFGTGPLISFGLNRALDDPSNPASQMVMGLLDQLKVVGKLDGRVAFDLDIRDLSQSNGEVDLKIVDAELKIDPALEMANQKFSKATIKAMMINGDFTIARESGLYTQELMVDISGNIKLKPQLMSSQLNLGVGLKLDKGMKDKFGIILDAKGGVGGAIRISIKGPLSKPNIVTS